MSIAWDFEPATMNVKTLSQQRVFLAFLWQASDCDNPEILSNRSVASGEYGKGETTAAEAALSGLI